VWNSLVGMVKETEEEEENEKKIYESVNKIKN
jgi:hypothetical protein